VSELVASRTFKFFARRALLRQQFPRHIEPHARFGLALIQETSAKIEIPRQESPRPGRRRTYTRGSGKPPERESERDSAQRTRFLFPSGSARPHRVPAGEWHKRDKRVAHNLPRTE